VQVVGAGPSGLSAAYHLTRLGHAVLAKEAVALTLADQRPGVSERIADRLHRPGREADGFTAGELMSRPAVTNLAGRAGGELPNRRLENPPRPTPGMAKEALPRHGNAPYGVSRTLRGSDAMAGLGLRVARAALA
jgi:glycine/D-amino acid oxidase-like deaminating enzyme